MLLIDNRAGSKDLYPLLVGRGLPCSLTRMDYGDVAFLGVGHNEIPIQVGIEVKTVQDVVNSLATGRFAGHQLPGLVNSYDQVWLLIEGLWRANAKTGILESRIIHKNGKVDWHPIQAGTRRFMYADLLSWLFTVTTKGGIRWCAVSNWNEATIWLSGLYAWWTKGWDNHQSHLAFHDGTRHGSPYKRDKAAMMVASLSDKALLVRPSLCRMVAAQLPGVGWEKSKGITEKFRTVESLVAASPDELMDVDGVGPKLAKGIWEGLRSIR